MRAAHSRRLPHRDSQHTLGPAGMDASADPDRMASVDGACGAAGGRAELEISEIETRIEQGIPGARVEVTGEDAHYSALVVSPSFEGKSRVEQHRMVYATLREAMASQAVHALALRTLTPAQWERDRTREGR